MTHIRIQYFIIAIACFVVACGGGNEAVPAQAANPNAFPTALPAAGDWFVFTSSVSPTLPAGAAPGESTYTRHYYVVNADGSYERADTYAGPSNSSTYSYNGAGAVTSATSGTRLCTFAPALRGLPPLTSVVGDSYNSTSTETCATQPTGALPAVFEIAVAGNSQAVESKATPLGSFTAFRYSQTTTSTTSGAVNTNIETCWIDKFTGRTVECTSSYSYLPLNATTPTSAGTAQLRLVAYSFRGQPPVGPAVRRFAGYWNVVFAGSNAGDCSNLQIDINGLISGSCRFFTSVGVYGSSFAVTGSVASNGSASVIAATGTSLSGTFTTPSKATGTWSSGVDSGTWTATHI
jgi:hypothetical protein